MPDSGAEVTAFPLLADGCAWTYLRGRNTTLPVFIGSIPIACLEYDDDFLAKLSTLFAL